MAKNDTQVVINNEGIKMHVSVDKLVDLLDKKRESLVKSIKKLAENKEVLTKQKGELSQEVRELEARIGTLEQQAEKIVELEEEIKRLKNIDLEGLKRELFAKLEGLSKDGSLTPEMLKELMAGVALTGSSLTKEQFEFLVGKISELQASISSLPSDEKFAELKNEISNISNILKSLKVNDPEEVKKLQDKIFELEEELKNTVSKEDYDKAIAEYEKQIDELKKAGGVDNSEKIAKLERAVGHLRTRVKDFAAQLKNFEGLSPEDVELLKKGVVSIEDLKTLKGFEDVTPENAVEKITNLILISEKYEVLGAITPLELQTLKYAEQKMRDMIAEWTAIGYKEEEIAPALEALKKLGVDISKLHTEEELKNADRTGFTRGYNSGVSDANKKKKLVVALHGAGGVAVALALSLGLGIPLGIANNNLDKANQQLGEVNGIYVSVAEGQGIIAGLINGDEISPEKLAEFEASLEALKSNSNENVKLIGEQMDAVYQAAKSVDEAYKGALNDLSSANASIKTYTDFILQIEQTKKIYNQMIENGEISEEEMNNFKAQLNALNDAEELAVKNFNSENRDSASIVTTKDGVYTIDLTSSGTLGVVFETAANYISLKNDSEATQGHYVGLIYDINTKLTDMLKKIASGEFKGFTEDELDAIKLLESYTDDIKETYKANYGENADFAADFAAIIEGINGLTVENLGLKDKNQEQALTISEYMGYLDKVTDTIVSMYTTDANGNYILKPIYTLDENGEVVDNSASIVESLKAYEAGLTNAVSKGLATEIENIAKGAGYLQEISADYITEINKVKAEYDEALAQIGATMDTLNEALSDGKLTQEEYDAIKEKYSSEIKEAAQSYVGKFLDVVELIKNLKLEGGSTGGDSEQIKKLEEQVKALESEVTELMKDRTFNEAFYTAIIGSTEGKTPEEIRKALAEKYKFIYEEMGGQNPAEKDEATQPGNN